MDVDLYLSYSGRRTFLLCPYKYYHRYDAETPVTRDVRKSLFGSVMGKLFEWFYMKDVWARPDPEATLLGMTESAMEHIFINEKWDPASDPHTVAAIRRDVKEYVPTTIDAIKTHKLISPATRAEFSLQVDYKSPKHGMTVRIGGKVDFLHPLPLGSYIIDGKGTSYREEYTDTAQLIWYATQHYIKFHKAPARIGFLYYKFPKDPVQWVSYDEHSIRNCLDTTFEVAKKIRLKMFDPTPSLECKRCDYRPHCPKGQEFIADRSLSGVDNRITNSTLDIDLI